MSKPKTSPPRPERPARARNVWGLSQAEYLDQVGPGGLISFQFPGDEGPRQGKLVGVDQYNLLIMVQSGTTDPERQAEVFSVGKGQLLYTASRVPALLRAAQGSLAGGGNGSG